MITIAIDGYSSCGKSTLAKALARELGFLYIDSGAMYRAVTLYALHQGVATTDPEALEALLPYIRIHFEHDNQQTRTFLNGRDVEDEIRRMSVSEKVSEVAAVPAVRRAMVAQQQALRTGRGIVMDGRDIGTVVFPDAELKIFLTADMEERVRRRILQLQAKGIQVEPAEIRRNLEQRDHIDSTRSDSPLRQADDAVVIDNTNLTETEQLAMMLALARERLRNRQV